MLVAAKAIQVNCTGHFVGKGNRKCTGEKHKNTETIEYNLKTTGFFPRGMSDKDGAIYTYSVYSLVLIIHIKYT